MSIEQYFAKVPKDIPLSLSCKPSPPAPKRQKRGPGRPRKKQPQPPVIVTIDDSDKEDGPDDTQGSDVSRSSSVSETTELEAERTTRTTRLYGTKQKRVVVVYPKEHSVAAATKKFSIPRSTIARPKVSIYAGIRGSTEQLPYTRAWTYTW